MFKAFIFSLSLGISAIVAPPATADPMRDRIIEQLKGQGFQEIAVTRTFLGRTRIVAKGSEFKREIIINGSNGVILRDFWVQLKRDDGDSVGIVAPAENAQSNSGSGSSGDSSASSPDNDEHADTETDDSSDDEVSDSDGSSDSESSDSSDSGDSSDSNDSHE